MSLATFAEMSVRVPGGIPAEDEPRAQAYLDDATALIEEVIGLTSDVPAVANRVCLAAALRAWFNPAYLANETLGDLSTRYSSLGGVYLTDDERSKLRAASGSSGFWVQPIDRHDRLVHRDPSFLYVSDGGSSFPFVPVAE